MTPVTIVSAAWLVWVVSWLGAARWSHPTVKRAGDREMIYRALTAGGAVLLGLSPARPSAASMWWQLSPAAMWTAAGIVVLGLLFTWWARIHLGRLWSSSVTRKEHHHIIDTGPYALVRHPIYTGLTLAVLGTAGIRGTTLGVVGALLMTSGIYVKARLEESFLRAELGAKAYDAYVQRVPMFVPFAPR
jgi:protein-S-isoprenylcysteine O-methyltransferase Ste14